MFKIWCEWDVGQENLVFTTEVAAEKWLVNNSSLAECFEEGLTGKDGVDDLVSSGLVTVESVTVINEEGEKV